MNPKDRAKCINIFKTIFQQPIGELAQELLKTLENSLPEIQVRFGDIQQKLDKSKYSSIQEWKNDIIGLFNFVSRECGQDASYVFQTIIQMLNDELNAPEDIDEKKVISDVIQAIDFYLPDSHSDFSNEKKLPPLPSSSIQEKAISPVFTPDDICELQDKISKIRSSQHLSRISQIILSNSGNENGLVGIRGGISVYFETLSPYTLQIIQNFVNKITQHH